MDLNHIFNPENRFWMFIEKIVNVLFLGVIWALFSVPIITAGAATTSFFAYTLKLVNDEEGYVWKGFIRAFRRDFGKATVIWLAALGLGIFLGWDLYLCLTIGLPEIWMKVLFVFLLSCCLIYVMTVMWIFPLMACFEAEGRKLVKDALIMAIGNLPVTFTIMLIYGAAAALTYYFTELFVFWFALAGFFSSFFYRSVFCRYINTETEEETESAGEDDHDSDIMEHEI